MLHKRRVRIVCNTMKSRAKLLYTLAAMSWRRMYLYPHPAISSSFKNVPQHFNRKTRRMPRLAMTLARGWNPLWVSCRRCPKRSKRRWAARRLPLPRRRVRRPRRSTPRCLSSRPSRKLVESQVCLVNARIPPTRTRTLPKVRANMSQTDGVLRRATRHVGE